MADRRAVTRRRFALTLALASILTGPVTVAQDSRFITLASTTSTEQSGLFGHVLPLFRRDTGIEVRVVAVGTGQALALAARGDADAVLVHDRAGEDKFVADGHGFDRRDVMFNDYVLVGPAGDPAKLRGVGNALEAFSRLGSAAAPFASRGDDSGTHRAELRFWRALGVEPAVKLGSAYRSLGQGMGPTLNTAAGMGAYAFTDRATWASFRNRQDLTLLVEGDPALFNPYGSILVSPATGAHIKAAEARTWHDWLTSKPGRDAIASFKVGGEQLFYPTGSRPGS